MGALMRAHDWSGTPLGPPHGWPEILKTSLRLVLTSYHPMFIWWGPELIQFYNDAYRETMGPERHPGALGQPGKVCWTEIWHIIGPQIESVMAGGPSTWHQDQLVPVTRHGRREDVWWTYGYSPIQDSAGVHGILVVCNDVTTEHLARQSLARLNQDLVAENQARKEMEQQQTLQLQIADALRGLTDASRIAASAFRLLGEFLAVSRILYAEIDEAGGCFKIQSSWQVHGLDSLAGWRGDLSEYGQDVLDALRRAQNVVVEDTCTDPRTMDYVPAYDRLGTRAFLVMPLMKEGTLVAVMALHQASPHAWAPVQIPLVENVADRVWNALEHARFQAQRERAEQALVAERQAASERLRSLFEQAPGFMAILRGPEHVFEFANSAYLHLVGARDLLGLPIRDALPDIAGQGFYELLDTVFRTGQTYSAHDVPASFHRTGDAGFTCSRVDFVYQPIIESNGKVSGIFVEGVDATERHAAQKALEASKERLKEGLVAARMVVWDWDLRSSRVTFSENALAVFGGVRSNMQDVWQCMHPDDAAELGKSRNAAVAVCGEYERIVRFVRPVDGVTRWLQIQGRVIGGEDGVACSIRGVAIDVTARKQAEEALKDADRRKDEFLAMLAHELRNPLAPISSAAQLLKAAPADGQRVVRTSEIITRQVEHMTSLINDLLDVSRVTTGIVTLDKQRLDVNQVVLSSIEQVLPSLDARRHRFHYSPPEAVILVLGDRKRLVQVITNLLQNAAKYTPEGGDIVLYLGTDRGEIVIGVEDNGVGIDPVLLPHVFELFTQAKRTSDRSEGGLGLGLALVKSLVASHGGCVTATSKGLGRGSTFTMRLPAHGVSTPALPERDAGIAITSAPHRLRLLVVDDNVDAANALAMFLEAAGHQVAVEHRPSAVLERVPAASYDVYLMDIGLPGMDGNELARRLRARPQSAQATFIAVTGYGQQYDKDTAIAAGFDYYFVKPASPVELTSLLATIKPA
jgi:signal transduction histidine kinase/CheY-like chemotaxis protein